MLNKAFLMAASSTDQLPHDLPNTGPSKLLGFGVKDILLLLGVLAVIGLTLFLWVYLTRREKNGRLSRTPRVYENDEGMTSPDASSNERVRVRRKRRREPEGLPRNPTRGETGGLPPIRPDEPAKPTT
ncbi:MAG: hypothetical protein L0Y58_24370 [Verrucomicrobia subdivision 3 bacterium]|nr:hypothetical protein [Limisphaerales bacterium]